MRETPDLSITSRALREYLLKYYKWSKLNSALRLKGHITQFPLPHKFSTLRAAATPRLSLT